MPYAPNITYQPIRADMSGWGNALMQIMGERDKKAEAAKEEAKQFKTLVAYGEQIGLNKDELLTKDLGTVKGMVEGTVAKNKIMEEGEKLKQLMQQRGAQEALQRAMQSAGTQQAPARQVPTLLPGQPGLTMMNLPAMNVSRKVTPDNLLSAMAQNPAAVNAPAATDLLRIMQSGGGDPLRQYNAETERMRAEAYRNQTQQMGQPRPTATSQPTGVPEQPDVQPPEGYVWTFDGRNWAMKQPRGKSAGEAIADKLGATGGTKATGKVTETIRVTREGRRAVFNADTKEFLRYAD